MNFSLYIQLSEKNAVDKVLTSEQSFSGNILGETSVVNPVFLIQAESLSEYNYMFVPDFNRWYFIQDIEAFRTNLWRVRCSVDVLMTYKEYIRKLRAIIASQETYDLGNSFLDNGTFVADNRVSFNVVNFPSGFDGTGSYILVTIGPGGVQTN